MKVPDEHLVMVQWYTYKRIPRQLHAIVVPYAQAVQWQKEGAAITVSTIDTELFYERRPEADQAGRGPRKAF